MSFYERAMKILRYYKITLSEIVKIKQTLLAGGMVYFLYDNKEQTQLNRSQHLSALHKQLIDGLKQN